METPSDERRQFVRRGYDLAAERYLRDRPVESGDVALLSALNERLQPPAAVLDVGCGAGVPVARRLVELGYEVIGLDFSPVQLSLARRQVPGVRVVQADMLALPFGSQRVDAVVCYYALIHVPRDDHSTVFGEFIQALRPGGLALLCLGSDDNPEDLDRESWLGIPMYWSHFDAATTTTFLVAAGFAVISSWEIPDPMGHGSHRFVLARAEKRELVT